MYNLRYHIASLVAVFLALAIGLVLGGLVVRQGAFDSQQRALVTSLQTEFNRLKKDNTNLKSSLSLQDAYAAQMTDAWVAGRLSGRNFVVLTSGGKNEGLDAAVTAIKTAGGTPAVVTILKPGLGLSTSAIASATASVLGTASGTPTSADVAKSLVAEWSGSKTARPLTTALVSSGAIKVAGLSGSAVATQAIDIAAFDGDPDAAALDIAQAYAAAGMFALGAQPFGSDTGVAAAASARQMSAFDTLGTSAGKFTLVALFSGGQQGYYSTTARGATPFPPVPKP
jgi:ketopantoate reductase